MPLPRVGRQPGVTYLPHRPRHPPPLPPAPHGAAGSGLPAAHRPPRQPVRAHHNHRHPLAAAPPPGHRVLALALALARLPPWPRAVPHHKPPRPHRLEPRHRRPPLPALPARPSPACLQPLRRSGALRRRRLRPPRLRRGPLPRGVRGHRRRGRRRGLHMGETLLLGVRILDRAGHSLPRRPHGVPRRDGPEPARRRRALLHPGPPQQPHHSQVRFGRGRPVGDGTSTIG
uniref:Uncharacterized protein n=1 Tax=Setaria viridis TaxID=4556 RepID=A0A4U6UY88_SETVI|nr:hypothetical protein SEVIR_4G133502v2 [Setaria viridis]